ncbi:MAG: tRNA uridine-5-carboxymethylaminomethyl(34) synthesis GTPase MnmE [Candidatus Aminicenantes bacterium]|nr:tRNA uridine-5-carboxymethylaminomethyl(34) synthesis GTPase MnmE [Candidatus Aminicenantes bacterium]
MENDTIAALSTPPGRGGIAVTRISGEKTREILEQVIEGLPALPAPRRAYHGFVVDRGKKVDECIVVFFKAPHSYSGEDQAEISTHGSPFLVEAVLDLIYRSGARPALPGEFTYRAFRNGKMDLMQAEAVNELINANSRYYAALEFGSLEGKLSRLMHRIKDNLTRLGIKIETKIEFEEEQFFEEITLGEELSAALTDVEKVLSNSRFNDLLNRGLNIVIVGKVNVGKSSLFNALLLEERSIISSIPGTTRDFIKEKLYIDGLPVEIFDVAGINRETKDEIEARGIERSLEKIEHSDAVIFMLDASLDIDETDEKIYDLIKGKQKLVAVNKIDILDPPVLKEIKNRFGAEELVEISVKEDSNIGAVGDFLKGLVGALPGKEMDFTVNRRQKLFLEKLYERLVGIKQELEAGSGSVEIAAEEIRAAIGIIGELMGEISTDDILNGIFSQFCVGK